MYLFGPKTPTCYLLNSTLFQFSHRGLPWFNYHPQLGLILINSTPIQLLFTFEFNQKKLHYVNALNFEAL